YSTPQVAIQEFQVNTSNYTVEYGRAVGGVVNAITRSGTNAFHGELYFRDRDAEWGTKNPFTTIARQATPGGPFSINVFKPKDWRKQFGGGVGGPIIKDKVFFFLAIDKFKRNFPGVAVASNPTSFFATPDAALPTGVACNGTGAAAPSAIDASVCTLAANLFFGTTATVTPAQFATASSNYSSGLTGLNSLLGPVPRTGDQNIFFPKVDWQINTRNHLALEVNRLTWASPAGIQTQATNQLGNRSFGDDFVKLTFGIAKLDTTITNALVNQLRYQYGRDFEYETAQVPSAYEQSNIDSTPAGYVNPLGLPPSISITNAFTFGTPTFLQRPRFPDERRWQIADTMNYTRGRHSIKFGVDFLHTDDLAQNLRTQFGTYSYNDLPSYFTDFYQSKTAIPAGLSPTQAAAYGRHYSSYSQAFGPLAFEFTTKDYGFFAQDEWKVLPRLSLTIGARYDYEQLPTPYASLVNPALPLTASFHTDKNNIAPRLGFAVDVFGNGKTSLRGGAGIFYGRTINSAIYSALTATGNLTPGPDGTTPVSQATFFFTNTTAGAPGFPMILPTAPRAVAAPSAVFFDKNFQNPYVYQGDLTLEQDLGWKTTLAISYLGALGRESPQFVDDNLPAASGTISYTVVDTSNKGPLPAGSTYTTRFYAKVPGCTSGRPNCNFGSLTRIYSGVNSSYHALAAILNHRATDNLEFQMNYTFSHGLDNGGNNSTFNDTNDQVDPANPRADHGNSNQNVPNRLVAYAIYTTPSKYKGALGYLLNGYQLSPSFAVQNGLPYSAGTSGSPSVARTSLGQANSIGGGVNGSNGAFRIDVLGRNGFKQPNTAVLDFRFSKHFAVTEHSNVELLIESFNLVNHQNVTAVNQTAYFIKTSQTTKGVTTTVPPTLTFNTSSSNPLQPLFGSVTNSNSNLAYSPRQVQVGAKFHF
ncbi:MAG: TonB-dependent receptor, partial [Acidobacteriota bacterium]|nr:TonB-dependent receptor [Acidobacteriota bacterium]